MPKQTTQLAHRRIAADRLQAYEGREHRCLRDVLFWLLAGPDATRTGLRYCRPANIAHELGWSIGNVEAALDRLQADGAIVRSPAQRSVLCLDALACGVPTNDDHRVSLRRDIERHAPCACATKALEMIGANTDTKGHTKGDMVSDISVQRTDNSEQTIAAAPPAVDESTTTPPSEQLTLTLKTPKAKKEPNPKWQQAEAVRQVWNERAAVNPGYAECTKLLHANVGVLSAAFVRLGDADAVRQLLLQVANDPWQNGNKRLWGIAQFFAAANLDNAIAQSRRNGLVLVPQPMPAPVQSKDKRDEDLTDAEWIERYGQHDYDRRFGCLSDGWGNPL